MNELKHSKQTTTKQEHSQPHVAQSATRKPPPKWLPQIVEVDPSDGTAKAVYYCLGCWSRRLAPLYYKPYRSITVDHSIGSKADGRCPIVIRPPCRCGSDFYAPFVHIIKPPSGSSKL
jgi:hypothetical protein